MTTDKARVLFLCTGNSCRSQMAEGWLRHLAGERFESLSAGTDPVGINPLAIRTMASAGVDLSGQSSDSIDTYLDDAPDLVIAVCDRAATNCPTLPGATRVLRWPFPDPADATGTEDEVLIEFAAVSQSIRARLEAWLAAGAPFEEAVVGDAES